MPAPALAQPPTTIAVGDATIGQGLTGAVVVNLRDMRDLYGADVRLSFDPTMLQAEDANPAKPGVQVAIGRFLSADLVVRNTADNVAGAVHVVVTQLNPAAPVSGSGELFSVTFRALVGDGTTRVAVAASMLSSRDGIEIPAGSSAGVVTFVARSAAPATPTVVPVRQPTLVLPQATGEPTGRSADGASASATARPASNRRSTAGASTSGTGAGGPSGGAPGGQAAGGGAPIGGAAGGGPGAAPPNAGPGAATLAEPSGGALGAGMSTPTPAGSTLSPDGAAHGAPADGGMPAHDEAAASTAPDASAEDAAAAEQAAAPAPAATAPASRRPLWPWAMLLAVLAFAGLVAVVRRS